MRQVKGNIFWLFRYCVLAGLLFCISATAAEDAPETNVSVITAEDIRREHPASVTDLLRTRAGIDNSSGTITMRGVQGVAVLLNGLPASLTDLNQLSLDDIERIEIARGAASARFGANAMGGAIIVTTRHHAARPALTLLASSSGSLGARFGDDLELDGWRLGVAVKDESEHGYRGTPAAPYPNQVSVEDERYRKKAYTLRGSYQLGDGKLALELKQADTMAYYGRPNWHEHYLANSLRASATGSLVAAVGLEVQVGREQYNDLGVLDAGTGLDAAGLAANRSIINDGSTDDAELALVWRGVRSGMRFGTAYRRAQDRFAIRPYGSTSDIFTLESITINRALFVHFDRRLDDGFRLSLDGRLDRHEYPYIHVFDAAGTASAPPAGGVRQAFSPKLELGWDISGTASMNASVGTGFIAPTPDQLYYSDQGAAAWMLGNPTLRPQRSQTRDVGVKLHRDDDWSLAATLFQTAWTDKIGIAIIDYGIPLKRQYANIGAAGANGLELEAQMKFAAAWSGVLNYTYTRARIVRDDTHPERVGNDLPDMPPHKLNCRLTYNSSAISGQLVLRVIGHSYTDEANTRVDARGYRWDKPAYAVLDASVTRRLGDMDVAVAVDNIFDRHYATGFFRIGQPRLLRFEANWRM